MILSASVKRFSVPRMRDCFIINDFQSSALDTTNHDCYLIMLIYLTVKIVHYLIKLYRLGSLDLFCDVKQNFKLDF